MSSQIYKDITMPDSSRRAIANRVNGELNRLDELLANIGDTNSDYGTTFDGEGTLGHVSGLLHKVDDKRTELRSKVSELQISVGDAETQIATTKDEYETMSIPEAMEARVEEVPERTLTKALSVVLKAHGSLHSCTPISEPVKKWFSTREYNVLNKHFDDYVKKSNNERDSTNGDIEGLKKKLLDETVAKATALQRCQELEKSLAGMDLLKKTSTALSQKVELYKQADLSNGTKIEELERQGRTKDTQLSELNKKVETLEKWRTTAKTTEKVLKEDLERKKSELNRLQLEIGEVRTTSTALDQQTERLKQTALTRALEINSAKGKLTIVERERNVLKSEIQTLRFRLNKAFGAMNNFDGVIDLIKQEEADAASNELDAQYAHFTGRLELQREELDNEWGRKLEVQIRRLVAQHDNGLAAQKTGLDATWTKTLQDAEGRLSEEWGTKLTAQETRLNSKHLGSLADQKNELSEEWCTKLTAQETRLNSEHLESLADQKNELSQEWGTKLEEEKTRLNSEHLESLEREKKKVGQEWGTKLEEEKTRLNSEHKKSLEREKKRVEDEWGTKLEGEKAQLRAEHQKSLEHQRKILREEWAGELEREKRLAAEAATTKAKEEAAAASRLQEEIHAQKLLDQTAALESSHRTILESQKTAANTAKDLAVESEKANAGGTMEKTLRCCFGLEGDNESLWRDLANYLSDGPSLPKAPPSPKSPSMWRLGIRSQGTTTDEQAGLQWEHEHIRYLTIQLYLMVRRQLLNGWRPLRLVWVISSKIANCDDSISLRLLLKTMEYLLDMNPGVSSERGILVLSLWQTLRVMRTRYPNFVRLVPMSQRVEDYLKRLPALLRAIRTSISSADFMDTIQAVEGTTFMETNRGGLVTNRKSRWLLVINKDEQSILMLAKCLLVRDSSRPPLEMHYSVKHYGGFEELSWTSEEEEDVHWWLTNVDEQASLPDDLVELGEMIGQDVDIFDETTW